MMNLALNLERNAALVPQRPAVQFLDKTFTYAQINAAANQVANALKGLGIAPGDKVALSCPNLPYFPIIYYGILKAGAVVVPINVLLKGPEIAYHLQDSDAKAFFCFEGSPELPMGKEGHAAISQLPQSIHFFIMTADPTQPSSLEGVQTFGQLIKDQSVQCDSVQSHPDDTAVILYTSGTTGKPKGAELSQSNISMNAMVANTLLRQTMDDVHLLSLPLFHSFGQIVQMNSAFMVGATLVLVPRFDPDLALSMMEKYQVTIFAGVPTMYIALLNLPGADERHDMKAIASKLRLGVSGGAAMPVEVMRQFEQRFGISILEGYGLSETSPIATFSFLEFERIPGCVGKAVWGTQVRIVDANGKLVSNGVEGEVVVRGHNVMKGYYKRPEETSKAIRQGWFHTGDIGRMDEKGNLFIVDRLKDMIIRGGFNIYPREIEEVLMTHPSVAQVAVIGIPHEVHGEEVKAVLLLKAGHSVKPDEMIDWCKERMASYKYPRLVEVRQELPMTATGKILKREIK